VIRHGVAAIGLTALTLPAGGLKPVHIGPKALAAPRS
jgi:hypothetical protein